MNAGWMCTSERYQILHTGSLRWLGSCFTAWLHIFLEFQTSMFFVPENHQLQRSGPTSTRNSLCSARFGQHMARLRQIIGNTTWFAQTHHIIGTGASCVLKFSNFCHHIRSKQAGPRRNFTLLTHELVREWATRSLTRRFGLPLTTTKRLLRKLRSSDSQLLIFGRFSWRGGLSVSRSPVFLHYISRCTRFLRGGIGHCQGNGYCLGPQAAILRCRARQLCRLRIMTDRVAPKKQSQNTPLTHHDEHQNSSVTTPTKDTQDEHKPPKHGLLSSPVPEASRRRQRRAAQTLQNAR